MYHSSVTSSSNRFDWFDTSLNLYIITSMYVGLLYIYMWLCEYILRVCVWIYIACVCVCVCVCIYIYVCVWEYILRVFVHVYIYVYLYMVYIYMCVCVCVCVCACVYIYIYIYIYIVCVCLVSVCARLQFSMKKIFYENCVNVKERKKNNFLLEKLFTP